MLVFLLYQKGRDSRIFQSQDRAIDDFTLKGKQPFIRSRRITAGWHAADLVHLWAPEPEDAPDPL
jgi:hypothetical protein